MPTYEYACETCGKNFEVTQKMSDPALTECIHCGGKVRRLISGGSGIIFKGSGFYATDYKKSSCASSSSCPVAKEAEAKGSAPCCQGGTCSNHQS